VLVAAQGARNAAQWSLSPSRAHRDEAIAPVHKNPLRVAGAELRRKSTQSGRCLDRLSFPKRRHRSKSGRNLHREEAVGKTRGMEGE
jgi:hypothetical protein